MEENKREQVLELLKASKSPIKGQELAEALDVSRQAIVQYIAIIRASGINVIATRLGYMIPKLPEYEESIKTIYSTHNNEDIQEELEIIVDMGGKVLDVIVEHPVYGEIICPLDIKSRYDINIFLSQLEMYHAKPLSILTGGAHRHTIEVPNEEVYQLILKKLRQKSYID